MPSPLAFPEPFWPIETEMGTCPLPISVNPLSPGTCIRHVGVLLVPPIKQAHLKISEYVKMTIKKTIISFFCGLPMLILRNLDLREPFYRVMAFWSEHLAPFFSIICRPMWLPPGSFKLPLSPPSGNVISLWIPGLGDDIVGLGPAASRMKSLRTESGWDR